MAVGCVGDGVGFAEVERLGEDDVGLSVELGVGLSAAELSGEGDVGLSSLLVGLSVAESPGERRRGFCAERFSGLVLNSPSLLAIASAI